MPQLLVENGIWVRPFLSPPVFSADVLRNDGYMFRLCRRLALGLLQIGWLLTSRGSANLFADIVVPASCTSEAVSEAPPASRGSRGRPESKGDDDFPLICREKGLGRLPFEFACFWIKHQRAALSTRMTVVPIQSSECQMSKRKPATKSKHSRGPKIAAKAHRVAQDVVRSPKYNRLPSVGTASTDTQSDITKKRLSWVIR